MPKHITKWKEEDATRDGINDALKGQYDESKVVREFAFKGGSAAKEAIAVYRKAFFNTRGGKG